MKQLRFIALFLLTTVIISGCESTKIVELPVPVVPKIDKKHSIVKWPAGTSEAAKVNHRKDYPILNSDNDDIKKCSCGDSEYELWTWDDSISEIEIEGSKEKLVGGSGMGGVEGDPNFEFTIPRFEKTPEKRGQILPGVLEAINVLKLRSVLVDQSHSPAIIGAAETVSKINIAVVDTGINFYSNQGLDPFLMDTSSFSKCIGQQSGWNFVEGNFDVLDFNSHGTYVTGLITSQLETYNVPYRILPIKIFDKSGRGTYWDLICAFDYIRGLQEDNQIESIHLVNASFGYTISDDQLDTDFRRKAKTQPILSEILESLSQNTIIVTSSGNQGVNNDQPGNEHYLSQFDDNHIATVGGYESSGGSTVHKGNYGPISIDLGAPFSGYKYNMYEFNEGSTVVKPAGTSYGTAYTTSKIANFIWEQIEQSQGQFNYQPSVMRTNFLTPGNGWIKREPALDNYFNLGRFLEKP